MLAEKLAEMKNNAHMTNQQIADASNVPLGTVNRILSGQTDNPSFQTVADIVRAMHGDPNELIPFIPETQESDNPPDALHRLLDNYEERIRVQRKCIKILFVCLLALISVFVFIILYDITHPDMGYIRY